jgi:ferredoxin-NADP reductase
MKLRLIKKQPENAGALTFYFEPQQPIQWQPGQYLRYHLPQASPDERGENRFFSIASAPFENHIQLTTKFAQTKSSTFKQILQKMEIGDEIEAFGPSGHFTTEGSENEYVLIAGGIGITPFRAILMDLDHRQKPLNVKLIYANKSKQAVFKEELEALTAKHPEFKIYYLISDELVTKKQITENIYQLPGRVDESLIRKLVPDLQKPIYYISGPESMVMSLEKLLWDMGIPKDRTNQDYFSGYEHY